MKSMHPAPIQHTIHHSGEKTMVRVHWTPLQEIDTLERELSRLFDTLNPVPSEPSQREKTFTPVAELQDTPEAFLLHVELPGIDIDTLDIEATAESVTIRGDRPTLGSETQTLRSEFRYGTFQRFVTLPAQIQNTKVTASYTNGILTLTLPKSDAEKNRVVKVSIH
jgi:HSP20 family protein